jgi:hypothetical protein
MASAMLALTLDSDTRGRPMPPTYKAEAQR